MRGRIELCGNAASSFMSFAEASPVKISSAWLEAANMMLSNPVRLWAAAVAPMESDCLHLAQCVGGAARGLGEGSFVYVQLSCVVVGEISYGGSLI